MLNNIIHFLGLDGNDKRNHIQKDRISLKSGSLYFTLIALHSIELSPSLSISSTIYMGYSQRTLESTSRGNIIDSMSKLIVAPIPYSMSALASHSLTRYASPLTSTLMDHSMAHPGRAQSSRPW